MTEINNIVKKIFGKMAGKPLKIIISGPFLKSEKNKKVEIARRADKNASLFFQISTYSDNKVFHENHDESETVDIISERFAGNYKQFDFLKIDEDNKYVSFAKILFNKKSFKLIESPGAYESGNTAEAADRVLLSHDHERNYIIKEGDKVDWLIKLSVMNNNGKILASGRKKFRQINKFLEMISLIEGQIPENAEIIDFGCGKSYLTFAVYYYFNIIKRKNVNIIGLDLKEDVISNCGRLAEELGYDKLRFLCGDIEKYVHNKEKINMVITLHACDTATDYAIYNAVKWGADVILTVPCCQHELFSQIRNNEINILLKHGILKERFSSLLTDSIRAAVLETQGYSCGVMEFIDLEHTPKNILIRAVKKRKAHDDFSKVKKIAEMFEVKPKIMDLFGIK